MIDGLIESIRFGFSPVGNAGPGIGVSTGAVRPQYQSGLPPNGIRFGFKPLGSIAVPVVSTTTDWDTSDPVFYEHWRKLAEQIKPETPDEPVTPLVKAAAQTLRKAPQAVLNDLFDASSIEEVRSLAKDLNAAQRRVVDRLIADFERDQEQKTEELLLLSVI